MTKKTLLISIPVVALVLNGVGYLIVSKVRPPATKPTTAGTLPRPQGGAAAVGAVGEAPPAADTSGAARATEAQALAHRATGLAALEAADYPKALANFTIARDLLGDKAQVDELLRVTEQLRSRSATDRSPAPSPSPSPSPRQSDESRPRRDGATSAALDGSRSSARRSARRAAVAREESPAELSQAAGAGPNGQAQAQGGGLLIVTTTPRGLLVQVDDAAVDLTPMRTKVRPGSHRVALLDGDRKVYETTMEVRDGAIATLQKDLSGEQAAEPPRPAVLAPSSSREQSQSTVTPLDSSDARRTNPSVVAPIRPQAAAFTTPPPISEGQKAPLAGGETGTLSISSPGLYGVVWINGRPRGYPPLEVRDLPSGPVKVEVRVNGVPKRSSTVVVRAGSNTPVRIQSQEASP